MTRKEKWQFFFIGSLFVIGFMLLVSRLANLQVRGMDEYAGIAQSSMTKTIYQSGARGQVQDINGAILATDKKIYNIEFYRAPNSGQDQNGLYSKAIWEVIKLLEKENKEVKFDFWMEQDEEGAWRFSTKTTDEGVAAAREKMFRNNFYVNNLAVEDIYERLVDNYMIDEIDADFPEEDKLTLEDKIQVLSVWQEMQMNAFNSVPIVLAKDVKWATVMEVETRLVSLPGMSVSVENQRVYPKGSLASHILGYTGLMQSEAQVSQYVEQGYLRTDTIGLDGIERTMEQWLSPNTKLRRGYSLVEIDRAGRIVRQLENEAPTDGNTVKLTIDSAFQQVAERELASIIEEIRNTVERDVIVDSRWLESNRDTLMEYEENERDVNYAVNGAIVVLDMECRVLAMASAPDFDPNIFISGTSEMRAEVLLDTRNRLFNNAIASASTPGSVFKMTTALAALVNRVITLETRINDEGPFDRYDSYRPPRCWIPRNRVSEHSHMDVKDGIRFSCNYYFYTLGSLLWEKGRTEGTNANYLYDYAAKLGLTSRTNIDLPGEMQSVVGSQTSLYDMTRPITGQDQDTWLPVQVKNEIKKFLKNLSAEENINYSEERLDKAIKALMDMAVNNDQGEDRQNWMRLIRQILMEELGMTSKMVYRDMGDIGRLLNEIKWGGSYAIQTSIGQGITMITPVAMARYVAAVANGGYVYDVQIVDSIISPTGETIRVNEPVLVNDLSQEIAPYLSAIHEGMQGVVDDGGTASRYFPDSWEYSKEMAAKTGTAQTSYLDIENNAWFIAFAPYEEPEIAIVVFVPHGYAGAQCSNAVKHIIEYYMQTKVDDVKLELPAPNTLAQ